MPLEDQVSSTKSRQPGLENESPVLPCDPWRGGGGGGVVHGGGDTCPRESVCCKAESTQHCEAAFLRLKHTKKDQLPV